MKLTSQRLKDLIKEELEKREMPSANTDEEIINVWKYDASGLGLDPDLHEIISTLDDQQILMINKYWESQTGQRIPVLDPVTQAVPAGDPTHSGFAPPEPGPMPFSRDGGRTMDPHQVKVIKKALRMVGVPSAGGLQPMSTPPMRERVDMMARDPTYDQLEDEIMMARKRFLDTFEADSKKAGFRLAADLTAIERSFAKIVPDSDRENHGIQGLQLLRRLYTDMVGGKTLSMGSFGADPMDPAFNKQTSITMDDEESQRSGQARFHGQTAPVPVGRMRNVNESRRVTKPILYRIIKEELQKELADREKPKYKGSASAASRLKKSIGSDEEPADEPAAKKEKSPLEKAKDRLERAKAKGDPARIKSAERAVKREKKKAGLPESVRRVSKSTLYRIIQEELQNVMEQFPQDAQEMFDQMKDKDFESGESEEGGVRTTRTQTDLSNWPHKALAVAANGMADGWKKHRAAFEKTIAPANPKEKAMLLGLYQNKDIKSIQKWALGR